MIKKRALRFEHIEKKISDVMDSLDIIEENLPNNSEDFVSSGLIKEGMYKKIEFAIESIIDICNMINSDMRYGIPETEDSIIDNMKIHGVLSGKTIDLIKEMKKFRNILVHKYGNIDDKKAFTNIKSGLKDFEIIITEIENFLEKQKEK